VFDESRMKSESIIQCALFGSIEITISGTLENAEPSINRTWRGILIELREPRENTCGPMRPNSEPASNEIDESDLQYEKHDEPRI
jgi:hypothetical protein